MTRYVKCRSCGAPIQMISYFDQTTDTVSYAFLNDDGINGQHRCRHRDESIPPAWRSDEPIELGVDEVI